MAMDIRFDIEQLGHMELLYFHLQSKLGYSTGEFQALWLIFIVVFGTVDSHRSLYVSQHLG